MTDDGGDNDDRNYGFERADLFPLRYHEETGISYYVKLNNYMLNTEKKKANEVN